VSLTALGQNDALVPVVVVNIGAGGVALSSNAPLAIGDVLSFRLQLPGAERSIYIKARVRWTRQYGAIGCEFLRIMPADLNILNSWLEQRCQIKQPLGDV
jgi:hypothetical protein